MINERYERYAAEMSTPGADLFGRLESETRDTWPRGASMMTGALAGTFLRFIVSMKQPRRAVEIGTFTGWSAIEIASALPEGGTLVALDIDPETNHVAQRYAEEAGVADRIDFRLGPAIETLAELDGPFDFVFIDADKPGYIGYYEAVLPKLADDGLIVADNTLFDSLDEFNKHVRDDPRVEQVLLTVREGVTMIRKRR